MGCCDDPTEPAKINRTDVARIQQQYGNLVRDLFTDDPEKVILRQLNEASVYLTELAALNAHYQSVRKSAINLLEKESSTILQQIIDKEAKSEMGQLAQERLDYLKKDHGILDKFFSKE
ncbi:MAG: hypothetical protein KAT04_13485 [Methylococcales bacterium]|nr:hypothetical protein [Methylococcales bacterium]